MTTTLSKIFIPVARKLLLQSNSESSVIDVLMGVFLSICASLALVISKILHCSFLSL